jgi:hypothetical protein
MRTAGQIEDKCRQVQRGGDQTLTVKSVVHMVPGSAIMQTRADGSVTSNAQGVNWFHGLNRGRWSRLKRTSA